MLGKEESYGVCTPKGDIQQGQEQQRERREHPVRISDLNRAVEKAETKNSALVESRPNRFFKDFEPNPELTVLLNKAKSDAERTTGANTDDVVFKGTTGRYPTLISSGFDKNTPGSLKQLRWSIYELIERYEGDYGKTISGCLKQEVERLFQEYTHS